MNTLRIILELAFVKSMNITKSLWFSSWSPNSKNVKKRRGFQIKLKHKVLQSKDL